MQFFRRLLARIFPGRVDRRRKRDSVVPLFLNSSAPTQTLTIHRDVSKNGVRVYSLCGSCGARLDASATLCEECAQKRSKPPARPY